MQGLADGYFVLPYTLGHYIAGTPMEKVTTDAPEFAEAENAVKAHVGRLLAVGAKGRRTPTDIYRQLGKTVWDQVGMARNATGLKKAIQDIGSLRDEFWQNLRLVGSDRELNFNLELAGRVADFLDLGELMARDALAREESCGGHFREEYQTPDGEAKRDDERFCHVAAWESAGPGKEPIRHVEPLSFESIHLTQRSYK
jgi:succinate dehydrogenase / fumarate reductase flavoprotein subunit